MAIVAGAAVRAPLLGISQEWFTGVHLVQRPTAWVLVMPNATVDRWGEHREETIRELMAYLHAKCLPAAEEAPGAWWPWWVLRECLSCDARELMLTAPGDDPRKHPQWHLVETNQRLGCLQEW